MKRVQVELKMASRYRNPEIGYAIEVRILTYEKQHNKPADFQELQSAYIGGLSKEQADKIYDGCRKGRYT